MPELIQGDVHFPKRNQRYDFESVADGNAYAFVYGVDYEAKASSLITSARKWAAANGFAVDTKRVAEDGGEPESVILRFTRAPFEGADE